MYVTDAGLAKMRDIMRQATGAEPPPNHHGTIEDTWDDTVLINFDEDGVEGAGNAAPYPRSEVHHL